MELSNLIKCKRFIYASNAALIHLFVIVSVEFTYVTCVCVTGIYLLKSRKTSALLFRSIFKQYSLQFCKESENL